MPLEVRGYIDVMFLPCSITHCQLSLKRKAIAKQTSARPIAHAIGTERVDFKLVSLARLSCDARTEQKLAI